MRLAKLKTKKYDSKLNQWVSNRTDYQIYRFEILPTTPHVLFFRPNGDLIFEILIKNEDNQYVLDMTLNEVKTEINDALNFIPKYKIDWSDQENDLIGDFKRGLKP